MPQFGREQFGKNLWGDPGGGLRLSQLLTAVRAAFAPIINRAYLLHPFSATKAPFTAVFQAVAARSFSAVKATYAVVFTSVATVHGVVLFAVKVAYAAVIPKQGVLVSALAARRAAYSATGTRGATKALAAVHAVWNGAFNRAYTVFFHAATSAFNALLQEAKIAGRAFTVPMQTFHATLTLTVRSFILPIAQTGVRVAKWFKLP